MSRVRFADQCRDRHERRGAVHICTRRIAHKGDHRHGTVTWARRIPPPLANSSSAASPMR
ncbi:MAG: hypothetical protein ACREMO_05860 [Gemmatimonadales bacterium]